MISFGGSSLTITQPTSAGFSIQGVPSLMTAPGSTLGMTSAASTVNSGSSSGGGGMMGNVGMGVSIGQAIGAAVGAFITSKATSYVLKQQAEINKINEARMQMGYESALRAGESQISKVTREAGAVKAKQKNAMAANGVSLGQGSAAEVTATTEVNKKLDVRNIQENALTNSWNYSNKASQYNALANTQLMGAQYASDTAVSSTISKGLESIGTVADKWYYYNR